MYQVISAKRNERMREQGGESRAMMPLCPSRKERKRERIKKKENKKGRD